MSRSQVLVLVMLIAGCGGTESKPDAKKQASPSASGPEQAAKQEPPKPEARKPGLAAPPAEFPKQAKETLAFDDFWTVLGVERKDGLDEKRVVEILGEPDERTVQDGDMDLRYEGGPTITLRASGGVMFNLSSFDEKLKAYAGDPSVSLLGQTCDVAKTRLPFMDEVSNYSSCKHYTEDWFLDITVMCREDVSKVVVVWEPLPASIKAEPRPADHCN